MPDQSSAVATRAPEKAVAPVDLEAPMSKALDVITKGGIHIVRAEVTVPVHYQYAISAGRKKVGDDWVDVQRVGLTADGYDHINRFTGIQFLVPEFIHDEHGNQLRNPIHRSDYIYERMVAIWYNDLGQMQAYSEDLEVDYQVLYQQARLSARWKTGNKVDKTGRGGQTYKADEYAEPQMVMDRNEDGTPKLDDRGNPIFGLVMPDEEELKAVKRLYDLRATGIRYAQTVLKTRLMKVATGIRMLPINEPRPFKMVVFGYRDNLTPEQRITKAMEDQKAIFGQPLTAGGTLKDEDLKDLNIDVADVADAVIEGTFVEADESIPDDPGD